MNRHCLLFLVLPLLLWTAACHHQTTSSQAWQIELKTQPPVPTANQDTTFTLHVTDAKGQPVTGATADLSLVMTFMDMGKNVVHLQDRGNGDYSGVGQFTMAGDWDCHVTVQAGGKQQQQVIHYKIG
jgi:nitrogen fixation protein FixH